MLGNGAGVEAVEFAYTSEGPGGLKIGMETFRLKADQVFKAIGQTLAGARRAGAGWRQDRRDRGGADVLAKVWAGGDCASGGEDLTVTAVAEGRDAAEDIHASLMG